MNSLIENLNVVGSHFLDFAVSMLWQSSLLILLMLALDRLFARRVRAAIRYAFWLLVLVKLILPPALALPTSAAWWLRTVEIETPATLHYTVTHDSDPAPADLAPAPVSVPAPIRLPLSGAGWLLLVGSVVSAGLLAWLLCRWWQVTQVVRRATTTDNPGLYHELMSARWLASLRWPVRLKLVEGRMSPAVCGLFRPVILLPRSLVAELSPVQLRAVLLHELIHLRRADVWVNCAQALLQILYWWHPLVWVANARIRRVREEAVDDAVMLTLRTEADCYAPTLLEVAKLAFHRPLMSLGLVGIMESPSALRQRVERLVNFRAPRRAGLTLVSIAGLLAFSAIALPMGEAPVTNTVPPILISSSPGPADSALWTANSTTTVPPATLSQTNRLPVLITAQIYHVSPADDEALVSLLKDSKFQENDSVWLGPPAQHSQFTAAIKNLGWKPVFRPRILTFSGAPAIMGVGSNPNLDANNYYEFTCVPTVISGRIDLSCQFVLTKPDGTIFTTGQFHTEETIENGSDLVFHLRDDSSASNWVLVMNVGQSKEHFAQRLTRIVTTNSSVLMTRTFKLDYGYQELLVLAGHSMLDTNSPSATILASVRNQFAKAGIDLNFPTGKSIFYNERRELLIVRATESDLAIIERAIVEERAAMGNRFPWKLSYGLAVQKDAGKPVSQSDYVPSTDKSNPMPAGAIPILGVQPNPNFQTALQRLEPSASLATSDAARDVVTTHHEAVNQLDPDYALASYGHSSSPPPQIHIKARFLTVPKGGLENFSMISAAIGQSNQFTGVLSEQDFRAALNSLQSQPGVETLAEPEGVTLSGRQMAMMATEEITVVTNFSFTQATNNAAGEKQLPAMTPQTMQLETGPSLDTIAKVLPDGETINLVAIASVVDFLGYSTPPDDHGSYEKAANDSSAVGLPVILPNIKKQLLNTTLDIKNGQTVMMAGFMVHDIQHMDDKVPVLGDIPLLGHLFRSHSETTISKNLIVFITVTLVDRAGNPIHTDTHTSIARK